MVGTLTDCCVEDLLWRYDLKTFFCTTIVSCILYSHLNLFVSSIPTKMLLPICFELMTKKTFNIHRIFRGLILRKFSDIMGIPSAHDDNYIAAQVNTPACESHPNKG
jgi:hypothetical protein